MSAQDFAPNHVVTTEGDAAKAAYLVVSGKVELSQSIAGKATVIKTVDTGEIIGLEAVFEVSPLYQHTAKTLEACKLLPITADELNKLIDAQGPGLQALLKLACAKMKLVRNKRVEVANPATASDISKLVIKNAGKKVEPLAKALEIPLARLPFRIGGYPEDGEVNKRDGLHLAIPSQTSPLRVSRQHCEISVEGSQMIVRDLGSRFCTRVNGTAIGRGQGKYIAILQKGENQITLGSTEDNYTLSVSCV